MPVILISLITGNITAQEINTDIQTVSNIAITQRLAVFPLKMSELSRRNRSRIRTKFQTILGKRNNYFRLGPDQVRVILQSQGLNTTTECLSVECLASFGKNVDDDVEVVVVGEERALQVRGIRPAPAFVVGLVPESNVEETDLAGQQRELTADREPVINRRVAPSARSKAYSANR